MLIALVLVCSLATTPNVADCNKDNAVMVMQAPKDFNNPIECMQFGMAFLSSVEMGRDIRKDEYVKVTCARAHV